MYVARVCLNLYDSIDLSASVPGHVERQMQSFQSVLPSKLCQQPANFAWKTFCYSVIVEVVLLFPVAAVSDLYTQEDK